MLRFFGLNTDQGSDLTMSTDAGEKLGTLKEHTKSRIRRKMSR